MTVEFKATHRYARMAPRKAQPVMDSIRGLSAGQALDQLRCDKHRAAYYVQKVLASAVANALQNPDVRPNRLVVSKAFVQGGPLLFGRLRFRPGPMGRAMPFRRRTCHLHVFVEDAGVASRPTPAEAAPTAVEAPERPSDRAPKSAEKTTAKKAAAKKTSGKKTTAKRAAAKKPATKKPVTKKKTTKKPPPSGKQKGAGDED